MYINDKPEFFNLIKDSKALICDLDGTLLDSEVKHFEAWSEIIKNELGFIIDESHINRYISHGDTAICDMISKDFGISFDYERVIKKRRDKFLEYLDKSSFRANKMLIDAIKDNSICKNNKYLVTSQDIDIAKKELNNINLLNDFDFGYYNVKDKGDVYRIVSEVCKVDKNIKDGFVLFEDSPQYLEIGKNLGFNIIAVEHKYNKERLEDYIKKNGDIPVISFLYVKDIKRGV